MAVNARGDSRVGSPRVTSLRASSISAGAGSSARAGERLLQGSKIGGHFPQILIGQTFQQQRHRPVMTPAIAKITQLIEKIAFRFAGYTRVVRISSLLILWTMADNTGFTRSAIVSGALAAGISAARAACALNNKEDQKESFHENPRSCCVFPRYESRLMFAGMPHGNPLAGEFPYHRHQLINCFIAVA